MRNIVKKVAAGFMCCMIGMIGPCFNQVSAANNQYEQFDKFNNIIRTENWVTSYFLDDDESVKYPYIQCQALVYSNGMVEVYFWNTYQWDSSYDEEHLIYIPQYAPVSTMDYAYKFREEGIRLDESGDFVDLDKSDLEKLRSIDISYYPAEYRYTYELKPKDAIAYGYPDGGYGFQPTQISKINFWCSVNYASTRMFSVQRFGTAIPLSNLGASLGCFRFTNTKDFEPGEERKFRIFGHDFTITYETMNSYDITPELRSEIKELQSEIKSLNAAISEKDAEIKDLESAVETFSAQLALERNTDKDNEIRVLQQYISGCMESIQYTMQQYNELSVEYQACKKELEALKAGGTLPSGGSPDLDGDGYLTIRDAVWLLRKLSEAK